MASNSPTEVIVLTGRPKLILSQIGSSWKKRAAFLLMTLALVGFSIIFERCLSAQGAVAARPAQERHVLVISVDGMGASLYDRLAAKTHISNLPRLRSEGSYAEGVLGVYPTVTYPSHTTIATGRMPAEHGIYSNLSSRQAGKDPEDWFWFSKAIRVPTLWDEARAHHLSTGAVFWPVTTGAPIDWDVPEIWDPKKPLAVDPAFVGKYSTPGLLFEAVLAIGPPQPGQELDITRTRLAAFILKKHKPNLLLVHLCDLDGTEHQFGPNSPKPPRRSRRSMATSANCSPPTGLQGSPTRRMYLLFRITGFCPLIGKSGPISSW